VSAPELAAAVVGALALLGGVLGAVKFRSLRALATALLTESPHALRASIEALSVVVTAQGQSIEWLRGELEQAKTDLELARAELAEAKEAHAQVASKALSENAALRKRIAELEEQVKQLEAELARRRATPRKQARVKAEEPS